MAGAGGGLSSANFDPIINDFNHGLVRAGFYTSVPNLIPFPRSIYRITTVGISDLHSDIDGICFTGSLCRNHSRGYGLFGDISIRKNVLEEKNPG